MSTNAGTLLWRRMRIPTLPPGSTDIDTGLKQVNKSFGSSSVNEPPLGVSGLAAPPDGTPPASRIQVIPLAPTGLWASISHSEPYFNPTTGTVHVTFNNSNEGAIPDLNVLFWDPHTAVGPGQADTYLPIIIQ